MTIQDLPHDLDVITPNEPVGALPLVRKISPSDLIDALRKGFDDFLAMPTHAVFLGLMYVLAGMAIGRAAFGYDIFPLLYPAAAGFALIGPFAAVGLYELSRRREMGRDTSLSHVFDVRHSPSFKSILGLGALLLVMFVIWIATANGLYRAQYGYGSHPTIGTMLSDILFTDAGRAFLLKGNLIGLAFAAVALVVSSISFPLLLDRNVGIASAVTTSLAVAVKNPLTVMAWGLIVAALMVLGSLPLFIGLAVVVPVLGHATWHLYRKAVVPDTSPRPEFKPAPKLPRYGAQFPASLFVPSSLKPE
ncbi:MAG: DUF2189 domain-containing protein [Hyphomicrobiaceae bacterium]